MSLTLPTCRALRHLPSKGAVAWVLHSVGVGKGWGSHSHMRSAIRLRQPDERADRSRARACVNSGSLRLFRAAQHPVLTVVRAGNHGKARRTAASATRCWTAECALASRSTERSLIDTVHHRMPKCTSEAPGVQKTCASKQSQ